jgi:transposase
MAIRDALHRVCEEVDRATEEIEALDRQIESLGRQIEEVRRLETIPGIGWLTATAVFMVVGDIERFASARHLASYLGLTPRESSSGGKRWLGGISKRGDAYLRTLLVHGARGVLSWAKRRGPKGRLEEWALEIEKRRGPNKAAVALANKQARVVWAVWKRHQTFEHLPLVDDAAA